MKFDAIVGIPDEHLLELRLEYAVEGGHVQLGKGPNSMVQVLGSRKTVLAKKEIDIDLIAKISSAGWNLECS